MKTKAKLRGVRLIVKTVPVGDVMAGWISATYSDKKEPSAYFQVVTKECMC